MLSNSMSLHLKMLPTSINEFQYSGNIITSKNWKTFPIFFLKKKVVDISKSEICFSFINSMLTSLHMQREARFVIKLCSLVSFNFFNFYEGKHLWPNTDTIPSSSRGTRMMRITIYNFQRTFSIQFCITLNKTSIWWRYSFLLTSLVIKSCIFTLLQHLYYRYFQP